MGGGYVEHPQISQNLRQLYYAKLGQKSRSEPHQIYQEPIVIFRELSEFLNVVFLCDLYRDYVRQFCNVQNRAFLYYFMRDFDQFCA